MANTAEPTHTVRFADFVLDLRTAELRTNGHHVVLQEKPFQILSALLERPGEMVSREELSKRLWPGARPWTIPPSSHDSSRLFPSADTGSSLVPNRIQYLRLLQRRTPRQAHL
jgi:hypothetical protein